MAGVEAQIREIAERVAGSYGLEVVDVELRGGGKARVLRITLDRVPGSATRAEITSAESNEQPGQITQPTQSGVTLDDCQNVSREVSTILDVEEVVPGATYTLEVSSPGLDRKLVRARDYERFTGSQVKLATRDAVNGQTHFEGRLEGFRDGRLTLDLATPVKKSAKKKKHQAETAPALVEIELSNVERANLVPEFEF
jgi:ribosome maturation factor RimP